MTMVLLTELYDEPAAARREEFLECLRRNAENPSIDRIHLFVEPTVVVESDPKVVPVPHAERVTYRELFAYASERLHGRRVVIANADIHFDRSLARLDGYDLSGKLLCLSRWDVQPDGSAAFFDHPASQDAWIFDAPIALFRCDFPLGLPGCDNRLAWEAEQSGLALENPGRSIRALHLHQSGVRRYSERQRVAGPTAAVPAAFLATPWVWLVVPCRGRLADVQRTVDSLLAQPRSTVVLVDYSCPDGAGAWAREHRPEIEVVDVVDRLRFRGAEARNRGAARVDEDGVLCFLDADTGAAAGLSDRLLAHLEEGVFLVPDADGPGLDSALVCRKADFDAVGGFDEAFADWGEECNDLRAALRSAGLRERTFPAELLDPAAATERTLDGEVTRAVHGSYRRAKAAVLRETGGASLSTPARREIYAAVARRELLDRGLTPDAPYAKVAFAESMGYTVGTLDVGVSSHNNTPRPFTAIPEPLRGLQFTQVVASRVSPVDVRFLTSGRLFVLVGNDWDGYHVARDWLSRTAFDERLPPLETQAGTGFEVWSLHGDEGERFVLPTQVMLVAEELGRV